MSKANKNLRIKYIVPIYLLLPEVHTPFAYIRDFQRALFCTLQVHCSILAQTNAIKYLSHPVFITSRILPPDSSQFAFHSSCYNQSLYISIYRLIMQTYVFSRRSDITPKTLATDKRTAILLFLGPDYMEKSCPGKEGHLPSRVNFSERLCDKKS